MPRGPRRQDAGRRAAVVAGALGGGRPEGPGADRRVPAAARLAGLRPLGRAGDGRRRRRGPALVTRRCPTTARVVTLAAPTALAFDARGRLLAQGARRLLWLGDDGREVARARAAPRRRGGASAGAAIRPASFSGRIARSADGRTIAMTSGRDVFLAPVGADGAPGPVVRLKMPDPPAGRAAGRRPPTRSGARGAGATCAGIARRRPRRRRPQALPRPPEEAGAWAIGGGRLRRLPWSLPARLPRLALSPDGRTLAVGDSARGRSSWSTPTDGRVHPPGRRRRRRGAGFVASLAFSPDGRELAVGARDQVRLWSLAGPAPARSSASAAITGRSSCSPTTPGPSPRQRQRRRDRQGLGPRPRPPRARRAAASTEAGGWRHRSERRRPSPLDRAFFGLYSRPSALCLLYALSKTSAPGGRGWLANPGPGPNHRGWQANPGHPGSAIPPPRPPGYARRSSRRGSLWCGARAGTASTRAMSGPPQPRPIPRHGGCLAGSGSPRLPPPGDIRSMPDAWDASEPRWTGAGRGPAGGVSARGRSGARAPLRGVTPYGSGGRRGRRRDARPVGDRPDPRGCVAVRHLLRDGDGAVPRCRARPGAGRGGPRGPGGVLLFVEPRGSFAGAKSGTAGLVLYLRDVLGDAPAAPLAPRGPRDGRAEAGRPGRGRGRGPRRGARLCGRRWRASPTPSSPPTATAASRSSTAWPSGCSAAGPPRRSAGRWRRSSALAGPATARRRRRGPRRGAAAGARSSPPATPSELADPGRAGHARRGRRLADPRRAGGRGARRRRRPPRRLRGAGGPPPSWARPRDAAEAANRAKDRFLAALGHELRTPLTPVLLGVSYLLEAGDAPDVAAGRSSR